MGKLFRRDKRPAPLVPGRDRPESLARSRSYMFYTSRSTARTQQPEKTQKRLRAVPEEAEKQHRRAPYSLVTWLCFVLIIISAVKILLLVPQSRIVVSGNETGLELPRDVYAQTADANIRSSLLNRNKLTFNANGIALEMSSAHPELTSVVVVAPLMSNRPVIYVTAASPAFVLRASNGDFTLSRNGYALTSAATKNLVPLYDTSKRRAEIGKQFLAGSTVSFATAVVYQLQQAGLHVERLELPANAPYEVDVFVAGKPYRLRFNLQSDVLQQSGGAVSVMRQLGSNTPSAYIDMRVPGRAYYK